MLDVQYKIWGFGQGLTNHMRIAKFLGYMFKWRFLDIDIYAGPLFMFKEHST